MDIFEQLRSGADVDMATPEYAEAIKHMTDCANICFKINTTAPLPEQIRPLEEELFAGNLDKTSYLIIRRTEYDLRQKRTETGSGTVGCR